MASTNLESQRRELWLVGVGTTHSVAPALHTFIAQGLGLPWTYSAREFANVQECLQNLKSPVCAGGAVTMPWKSTILPYLDEIDESARMLAACNTIRSGPDGRLTAWNHDWVGISGALREGVTNSGNYPPQDARGLIIGAGGAARAAVYAMWKEGVQTIYVINRDEQEVENLQKDISKNYTLTSSNASSPQMVRIQNAEQVTALKKPFYVVSTVPDYEPSTTEEKDVKVLFDQILSESSRKGVVVDMCYKPRYTRHIQMAERAGWQTIQGWHVVGHQAKHQWLGWAGEQRIQELKELEKNYWDVLQKEAETNAMINPVNSGE